MKEKRRFAARFMGAVMTCIMAAGSPVYAEGFSDYGVPAGSREFLTGEYTSAGYDGAAFPQDISSEKDRLQGLWSRFTFESPDGNGNRILEGGLYDFHDYQVDIYRPVSADMRDIYTYERTEKYEVLAFSEKNAYDQVESGWKILIPNEREHREYWDIKEYWSAGGNTSLRARSLLPDGTYMIYGATPMNMAREDKALDQFILLSTPPSKSSEDVRMVYEGVTYTFSGRVIHGRFSSYELLLNETLRYSNIYGTVDHRSIILGDDEYSPWLREYLGKELTVEGTIYGYRGTPGELCMNVFRKN